MPTQNDKPSVNHGRRRFLLSTSAGAGAVLAITVLPAIARADELPHLAPTDPTAQALGYVEDTTKADDKKYPNHKPTQDCANCNFWQGGSSEYGACQLFPGKAVHSKGWCSAHAEKKA